MTRLFAASLSVRLVVLVLLGLLPGLGLAVYTAAAERRQEASHVKAEALLVARLASENQERLVAETRQLLDGLTRDPEILRGDPQACGARLADFLTHYRSYANFGVIAPSGAVVCSALPLKRPLNLGDRTYFRRAIAARNFAVGEFQVGRITHKATINFGYPVLDAAGRVQSVVFAALDLAWINRLAATAELPSGATLTLIDRQRTILARYPDPDRWVGRPTPQTGITAMMLGEGEGVTETRGLDGTVRLYGFTRLRGPAEAGDVYLSVGIPTAVAYADVNRRFDRTILVLGVVGVLVLVAAWLAGSQYILRPVNAVVVAAGRLAAGDLSARTGKPAGPRELNQLMHAFDEMARTLEAQTADVQEAEARYRALVEQSLAGVYLIRGGRFVYVNEAFAEMFGYSADELVRMRPLDLVQPDDRPLVEGSLRARLQGDAEATRYSARGLRRDGTVIYTEVFSRRVVYEGQPAVLGTLIDITDRRRAEEQIQQQLKRLAALRTIDIAITATDLRVTLLVLLEQLTVQLGVDAAAVLLLNPHTQTLEYAAGRGFATPALQHTQLRLGEGYAGRAAQDRRLISIPRLTQESGDLVRAPLLSEEAFVAYYAVPLVAHGQVQGVLEIFHRAELTASKDWLDFLDTMAGQAAIAVDNASLFADLQRSHADLALAYDTTLEGWSRALDLRDNETEGHSRRVTEMTLHLARAMGVQEPDLVHLRRGALLHDIGKMGIPDEILHKPGRLSNEEKAIMRRHPVYAYELLAPIDFLRPALDIPYCHHEKWDGTGYPRQLRGEQIPLAARIFAVADVWDALRSRRPYRRAWTERRARHYIRSQTGKHFDPRVVEVFFRTQRESQPTPPILASPRS